MKNNVGNNEKILSWAKLGFAAVVQCVVVVSYVVYFAADFQGVVKDVSSINEDIKGINSTIKSYGLMTYRVEKLEQGLEEVRKQCATCSR